MRTKVLIQEQILSQAQNHPLKQKNKREGVRIFL